MRLEGQLSEPAVTYSVAPVPSHAPENTFLKAARRIGREIDVGEAQVEGASRLHNYDTATLIALQAGIYRYTEAVDLASKIVDRATSATSTVFQAGSR